MLAKSWQHLSPNFNNLWAQNKDQSVAMTSQYFIPMNLQTDSRDTLVPSTINRQAHLSNRVIADCIAVSWF